MSDTIFDRYYYLCFISFFYSIHFLICQELRGRRFVQIQKRARICWSSWNAVQALSLRPRRYSTARIVSLREETRCIV